MGLISRVSSRTYRISTKKNSKPHTYKMPLNPEKLKALQAKAQQTTKVGGMRRKKKVVQKQGGGVSDDKRIQQTLKKFACSNLPGIDELKKITEIPGVLNQLGMEGLQGLQAWAKAQGPGGADGLPNGAPPAKATDAEIANAGNFDEADADDVE